MALSDSYLQNASFAADVLTDDTQLIKNLIGGYKYLLTRFFTLIPPLYGRIFEELNRTQIYEKSK